MEIKKEGFVEHIIFRNEENGYTVFELSAKDHQTVCVGSFPSINEGEYWEVEGVMQMHRVYGEQLKIEKYETRIPKEAQALEKYLGSGVIKGIGAALAARIIRHFGEDTLRILNEEPERLSEVKGISDRKARDISLQMEERTKLQEDMIFLAGYGISLNLSIKIHNFYQEQLYEVLRENPYRLAEDIPGVGFKTADTIAARAGIRRDSPFRAKSAILFILKEELSAGNIYLPSDQLLIKTRELLEAETEEAESLLVELSLEKKIVIKQAGDEKRVYISIAYFTELHTAVMLTDLSEACGEEKQIRKDLERIEKENSLQLDPLQREAVVKAAKQGVSILTGGPGTGKTTTINMMLKLFEHRGDEVLLAAPTGRAAKRMTETTGYPASTIHRLLEVYGDPEGEGRARFMRNKDNPLETDVVIIDETSMVDIFLFYNLLCAISKGTRLILVGDKNQLPSVGPGCVLRDIIESGCFAVTELNRIFRQASQSDIVRNAHRINSGQELLQNKDSKDFFLLERNDAAVIQRLVLTLLTEKIPAYVKSSWMEVQIITPMRKGPLGVNRLNEILQKYANPASPQKAEIESGDNFFREGDKVMQIKNDYSLEWVIRGKYGIEIERGSGVFNGDIGIVKEIDKLNETLTVEFDDSREVEYPAELLNELELAYAVTVHKAQGSEYPAVIMPLLGGPAQLLTRNLLYTAVTRARSCVLIVGRMDTVSEMIQNIREEKRYTSLRERIREMNI